MLLLPLRGADSGLAYLGGSIANEEPVATAKVAYRTATDWLASCVPRARLVQERIGVLERFADKGMADRLSHSMAHLLIANNLSTSADNHRSYVNYRQANPRSVGFERLCWRCPRATGRRNRGPMGGINFCPSLRALLNYPFPPPDVNTPASGTRTPTTSKTLATTPAPVIAYSASGTESTAAPRGSQPTSPLPSPQQMIVEIAPVAFTARVTFIGGSDSTAAKGMALVAAEAAFELPKLQLTPCLRTWAWIPDEPYCDRGETARAAWRHR
ncbi:hypothetical protein DL766_005072 [Monosporascus sp. MC13-8B]|uniref:Uncharacterized protein n=1 Tax=Monosporascus cannonballus TaxID=155416 RepID=A0ABY0HB58_9PEZI|nr:hypothetical protein DL763_007073 [Monosporascus cannonballus]RYO89384.1 hypothetical protein DL762_003275 [Monosporascus cannonballus]RYP30051.1 hypothetical protein DL766_005072 [Monosporascus sp. MC13-8B]